MLSYEIKSFPVKNTGYYRYPVMNPERNVYFKDQQSVFNWASIVPNILFVV